MIPVILNDKIYNIHKKILLMSDLAKHDNNIVFNSQHVNISDYDMIELLNTWLKFAPLKSFTPYDFIFNSYEFNINKSDDKYISLHNLILLFDFSNILLKQTFYDMLTKITLQDLLEIMNFSVFNQILLLSETIAKIISLRNIMFCCVDGKFYIYEHIPHTFPNPICISTTISMMITKYTITQNNIQIFPEQLLKMFKYNPLFNPIFDNCFNVETIVKEYLDSEPDPSKNYIIENCTYSEYLKYKHQIKFVNVILTPGDFGNIVKLEDRFNILVKNYSDYKIMINEMSVNTRVYNVYNIPSDFVIPKEVTEIGPYTFSWSKLEYIKIPNNITKINSHAFECSSKLKHIQLSENLQSIGNYAFNLCDIHDIVIPESVTDIGVRAFANNMNISVTYLGKPHIDLSAFSKNVN